MDTTSTTTAPDIRRRMLKGRRDNVSNMADFSRVLGVSIQIICRGLIRYSRHNLPPERHLLEDPEILESLPVELLTQLEIPVLAFQESEIYDIHRTRCKGLSTLGTTGVAMIGFGCGPERKTCMVRSGALFQPSSLHSSKSETTDVWIECAASLAFSL